MMISHHIDVRAKGRHFCDSVLTKLRPVTLFWQMNSHGAIGVGSDELKFRDFIPKDKLKFNINIF